MNDKEKIREYIEKLHKEHRGSEGDSIFRRALRTVLFYIDSMQQEPAKDLEEAIGEYCTNPDNFISYVDIGFAHKSEQKDDIPLIIKAIKFGAQWQKEQMLKDAIETTIMDDWIYGQDPDNAIRPAIHQRIDGYKVGDKVKIVILKEG